MKNKFLYLENDILRERFQKAKPFLTHDGRVADRGDFELMFSGNQPIREEYLEVKEFTDDYCKKYGETLEAAFNKIGKQRMISPKKAWQQLTNTKDFPQDEAYQSLCADILRGAHDLTKEEVLYCLNMTGGICPCFRGLTALATSKDDPIDISDLTKANKELVELSYAKK